jgi:NTE family protein
VVSVVDRVLRRPRPVAFVLAGGGNLGAIQVGMLRALVEAGVRPDVVVGCSVGALNGAAFCAEPTVVGVARLEELWYGIADKDVLPTRWLPSTIQLALRGTAIHPIEPLRQVVEEFLPVDTFDQLAVRFECVATEFDRGDEVWFGRGRLVDAILASAAIPAVYPPIEIDGARYVDGGVVNEIPISRAVELGARRIYVLHVGLYDRPRKEPRRPIDMAIQAFWIARRHRFRRDLATLPKGVEAVVLPTGSTAPIAFADFTRTRDMIAAAHAATADLLA